MNGLDDAAAAVLSSSGLPAILGKRYISALLYFCGGRVHIPQNCPPLG